MWDIKYFKTQNEAETFAKNNEKKYISNLIFVHNGYAIEYKKLKTI